MNFRFWTPPAMLALTLLAPPPACAQNEPPAALLDINRATAEQLDQLPGIGPDRAAAIVRLRERNGPFRGVGELRALPRMSEKMFQRLKPLVTVTSPPPSESASMPLESPSLHTESPPPRAESPAARRESPPPRSEP